MLKIKVNPPTDCTSITQSMFKDMSESSIRKINAAKSLLDDMRILTAKYQKLTELAENDYITTIRNEVNYHEFDYCYPLAKDYFNTKKEKKVREKGLFENKKFFDFLVSWLKRITAFEKLGHEIEITRFYSCGWESYTNGVEFNCAGLRVQVEVPDMKKLNKNNFGHTCQGMIVLRYEGSSSCLNWIGSSYDEDELAEKFVEFMRKRNEPIKVD